MSKLIIFDCDGTLVDSEIIAAKVFPKVWASMGLELMTEDYFICNFVGTGNNAEIVQKMRALLPAGAMEIADKKFEEVLAQELNTVVGIPELLEQLPFPMCVASNSSFNYVNRALEKTCLTKFFDKRVYSSRDLAKPKPAPDVFFHAAKSLGFGPEDCIVIEDSVSGIKAAQNAGMKVIGFMGGKHFNEVVKEKLLSAKADCYCSNTTQLLYVLSSS